MEDRYCQGEVSFPPRARLSLQPKARLSIPPRARLSLQPKARLSIPPRARLSFPPRARLSLQPKARLSLPPRERLSFPPRASCVSPVESSAPCPGVGAAFPFPVVTAFIGTSLLGVVYFPRVVKVVDVVSILGIAELLSSFADAPCFVSYSSDQVLVLQLFSKSCVGVEHLLRDVKDTIISTLATEVTGKLAALKGLDARLREIRGYLDLVVDGKLPLNHEILYHLQFWIRAQAILKNLRSVLKLNTTEDSEKSANSEESAEVSYEDDNDVNTD
ncbi:hypothetical protein POM88_051632 [Heracleum sosnowskyi]|uniref:EIF3F/CSN6-like C-terminal domain-containing protein n=1 Tax=Heracleum sosnowskyi TaxID=360622 RepID=A0AAD8H2L5_9APIA|nr:hypothetical protein POM88_051632 [Heracleum sosnowskyi]